MVVSRCGFLLVGWLALASGASAAITTTGRVNPDPIVAGAEVWVGGEYSSEGILVGSLTVDEASSLSLSGLHVGETGVGQVLVAGRGSSLSVDNDLRFGEGGGYGRLNVVGGATVSVGGGLSPGRMDLAVSGSGSVLTVYERIGNHSADSSVASVVVDDGAVVVAEGLTIGGRSEWVVSGSQTAVLTSGQSGGFYLDGRLSIRDGAVFSAAPSSSAQIGDGARVELDGGALEIGRVETFGGVLSGSGRVSFPGDSRVESGARIEVGAGERLEMTADPYGSDTRQMEFLSTGDVFVDGGDLEIQGDLINQSQNGSTRGAVVTLSDGVVRSSRLVNDATLVTAEGKNRLYGPVFNDGDGRIAVANGSTLTFHDRVTHRGGDISVMPGSKAVFLHGLDMYGGTLSANIAGTPDDPTLGVAEIVGGGELTGLLSVGFATATAPEFGDRFQILTSTGGLTTDLSVGDTPGLPDTLTLEIEADANSVGVLVVPKLDGDFNTDGVVNAADYTVWRNGAATHDFTNEDLQSWQANYGRRLGTGGRRSLSVPEPATALLLALAAALGRARRFRFTR